MDTSIPWRARPGLSADWSGRYAGRLGGVECTLELWLDAKGRLRGHFSGGGERLEAQVIGGSGGAIHGFLLEPGETSAIAVFRASLDGDGLLLELDIPDDHERLDFSSAERLHLERTPPEGRGPAE